MVELPRGAVTFLFTDIEGSTQLVKQLRDRYGEVLGEHQQILRQAFAKHGGHEIDTQGDAFFIAFASARDAVLAAVEGQRAISGYPWPDGASLRVRMGIHTGQASPVDGRYTGVAVHRAHRIMDSGHGGQVLVSQATQTLLEDEEEDLDVGLRDLGQQRLRGLDRPVQVYQVAAPGLPAEFPPLRREEEPAPPPARRRRRVSTPVLIGAGVIAVLVIVPVVALLATRGGGGLSGVDPNHVGMIDPESNKIVAQIQVGIRPGPVAVGDGFVWVGNGESDRNLSRIDPNARTNAGTISLNNKTPTGIAVGPGGVWVAHGLLGQLARVDPQFNQVTDTLDIAGRSDTGSVCIGGGFVWAVYGESTLARIDPRAVRLDGTSIAGGSPAGITYGADSVWVANRGESNVYRFNPSTFEEGKVAAPTVSRSPSGIAYGGGAIWVANTGSDNVSRIDPASTSQDTIRVGDAPTGIAYGDGAVWVANSGDGTVTRIDATTSEPTKTITTGNLPDGVALGDGYVWVTVQAP